MALDGSEVFSINSMDKMFTAILTLQLVDEEIISLNDNLNGLLKDFKHLRSAEITLHDLLSHRSGIRDYFLLQLDENCHLILVRMKCLLRLPIWI